MVLSMFCYTTVAYLAERTMEEEGTCSPMSSLTLETWPWSIPLLPSHSRPLSLGTESLTFVGTPKTAFKENAKSVVSTSSLTHPAALRKPTMLVRLRFLARFSLVRCIHHFLLSCRSLCVFLLWLQLSRSAKPRGCL